MYSDTYKFLSPLKRGKKAKYKHAIAIDIETKPDGSFRLGAVFGTRKNHHGKIVNIDEVIFSKQELIDFILNLEEKTGKKGTKINLVHHNASFDTFYYNELIDWKNSIIAGNKIISAKTFGGSRIFDTHNYFNTSLEKLIKDFDLDKDGISKIPFDKGINDRFELTEKETDNLILRCKMDAKATWYIFDWFQKFFLDKYNLSIRNTAPAMAFKVFTQEYFQDKEGKGYQWKRYERQKDMCDLERQAYYGGRAEIIRRGKDIEHYSFDVNSMYPSVMLNEYFPDPSSAKWEQTPTQETIKVRLWEKKLFIVDCTIKVPDMYIAPLPYKHPELKKLVFPVGTFRASWSSVEIQLALNQGAEIIEVHKMLTYQKKEKYFERWVSDMYSARKEAQKNGNGALQATFKLMMNSLYGKFGERIGRNRGIHIPFSADDLANGEVPDNVIPMIFEEGTTHPYGENIIGFYVLPKENQVDTTHTFTCIPAFVTAYARVKLDEAMIDNAEGVIYVDTDSIKIKTGNSVKLDKHQEALGKWGDEYISELNPSGIRKGTFYRAKMYDVETETETIRKRKGVGKIEQKVIEDNDEVEVCTFLSPVTRHEAIISRKFNQNEFIKREKILIKLDDKRNWDKTGEISRPLLISETSINAKV